MKFSFVLVSILFTSCSTPKPAQPISLVGKTIEYRYDESVYHVTIDTDSTLHWEAVAGDEKGVKANETYVAEFVAPQKYFITWGEENGIGVSQILDFEKGKVYNHLLRGRDASKGDGEIMIIEK
jgi:phenolic acid decarboxylase